VLAVRTRVASVLVMVTVPLLATAPVQVPVWVAAAVGDTPARLVLNPTKSFAQLDGLVTGALTSNVNLAGNIPMPTEPPASIDMPQSPGAVTLGTGVPPDGCPLELLLESAPLHPALTSSPQSAAAPNTVPATRTMFKVRLSLKITAHR